MENAIGLRIVLYEVCVGVLALSSLIVKSSAH